MKSLPRFGRIIDLLCGPILLGTMTCLGLAAEPLPIDIQNASSTIQEAYLEKRGMESLNDKLHAGQQRYALRLRYKQQLVNMMRQETQACLPWVNHQDPLATPLEVMAKSTPKGLNYIEWLMISGALTGAGYLLRLRFARAEEIQ